MHVEILNVENKGDKTINGTNYVTAEDWRDFHRRKPIPHLGLVWLNNLIKCLCITY